MIMTDPAGAVSEVKRYVWNNDANRYEGDDGEECEWSEVVSGVDFTIAVDALRQQLASLTEQFDQFRSDDKRDAVRLHREKMDALDKVWALEQQLAEMRALLHDSRSKFAELYLTLCAEDLTLHDLRELRTLADQGGLAIDAAFEVSPAPTPSQGERKEAGTQNPFGKCPECNLPFNSIVSVHAYVCECPAPIPSPTPPPKTQGKCERCDWLYSDAGIHCIVCGREKPGTARAPAAEQKHERRIVQHVTGRQELMDTCVCGERWPCPRVAAACESCGGTTGFVTRDGAIDVCDDPFHEAQPAAEQSKSVVKRLAAQRGEPNPFEIAAEREGVIEELRELMLFMCGEGEMVGLSFGDRNPMIKGEFWWRSRFLRPRIERAIALLEQK